MTDIFSSKMLVTHLTLPLNICHLSSLENLIANESEFITIKLVLFEVTLLRFKEIPNLNKPTLTLNSTQKEKQ